MTATDVASNTDIPYDSPLRRFPKRGLPPNLSSTYPHGHISGHVRPTSLQRDFEKRKAAILRTMNAEQIETAYQQVVGKITAVVEEDRKRNDEVEREKEKLEKQREMERRVFWKMRGNAEGRRESRGKEGDEGSRGEGEI